MDGKIYEFIEEFGIMNILFMIDGVLIMLFEDVDIILCGVIK